VVRPDNLGRTDFDDRCFFAYLPPPHDRQPQEQASLSPKRSPERLQALPEMENDLQLYFFMEKAPLCLGKLIFSRVPGFFSKSFDLLLFFQIVSDRVCDVFIRAAIAAD
jgi:hypothetical protein